MQLKQIRLFLLGFIMGSPAAYCQIGGTGTYDFMELPVSAHAAAMGGSYITAREPDLGVAANNPSFLDSNLDRQLILTYVPYFAGIQYGYAAYAQTFRNIGTFDAGVKYIDYGTFTQADFAGNITGTFTAGEYLLNIGYGRPVLDSTLSAGANLKIIYSHLAQYYSIGVATDLAGSYISPGHRFYAGLLIQNIGSQIKEYTPGDAEPLPFDIQAGIAAKLLHAPFRFNLTMQHLQKWDITYIDPADTATVNALTGQSEKKSKLADFADKLMRHLIPGVEVLIGKNFALRFAYNYERRQELKLDSRHGIVGLSGGFALKIYKFHISYALAGYHLAGASNTFTIGFNLGDFIPQKAGSVQPSAL